MAKELAVNQILVNAVMPGATMTQERHEKIRSGNFSVDKVPEDAVKTRETLNKFVNAGAFVQLLTAWMPENMEESVKGFAFGHLMTAIHFTNSLWHLRVALASGTFNPGAVTAGVICRIGSQSEY